LVNNGYEVENQIIVPIRYGNMTIDADLRLDLLVNDTIVVELKSVETLHPVFEAQLLTYMKLLQKPQGLRINFFTDNITKSSKPFVNEFFRQLSDE
jgi:GxxExxY protein